MAQLLMVIRTWQPTAGQIVIITYIYYLLIEKCNRGNVWLKLPCAYLCLLFGKSFLSLFLFFKIKKHFLLKLMKKLADLRVHKDQCCTYLNAPVYFIVPLEPSPSLTRTLCFPHLRVILLSVPSFRPYLLSLFFAPRYTLVTSSHYVLAWGLIEPVIVSIWIVTALKTPDSKALYPSAHFLKKQSS